MNRRDFLATAAASSLPGALIADERPRSTPPPLEHKIPHTVAIVTTAWHYLSHAYHIGGRFLNGYLRDGKHHFPKYSVAGVFVEQKKANDLSERLAKKH